VNLVQFDEETFLIFVLWVMVPFCLVLVSVMLSDSFSSELVSVLRSWFYFAWAAVGGRPLFLVVLNNSFVLRSVSIFCSVVDPSRFLLFGLGLSLCLRSIPEQKPPVDLVSPSLVSCTESHFSCPDFRVRFSFCASNFCKGGLGPAAAWFSFSVFQIVRQGFLFAYAFVFIWLCAPTKLVQPVLPKLCASRCCYRDSSDWVVSLLALHPAVLFGSKERACPLGQVCLFLSLPPLEFCLPIAVFPVSPVRFLLQVLLPCHPSASLALVPRSTQYAGVQVLAVHDFLLLLHRVLSVVGAFAASFGVSVRCHLLVLLVDFCSLVGSTGPTCIVLFPFSHSCISRNVCKAVKGLVNLCLSVDSCKWILGLVLEPPDQRFKFF
jgi:hypothetical protein